MWFILLYSMQFWVWVKTFISNFYSMRCNQILVIEWKSKSHLQYHFNNAAANKIHVMTRTWFGIKRHLLCSWRIFNRAYLTCLIMYEYVGTNEIKSGKKICRHNNHWHTWSVDAKILHISLLTRCSEKFLTFLSFLLFI